MVKHVVRYVGCILLLLIACFFVPPRTAYAEYAPVTSDTRARVLRVIDGDALMVEIIETEQIALVRLAGIATLGNDDAYTYITTQLLGRDIDIKLDYNYDGVMLDGRWTPVYVYYNNLLYNQSLLQKGFAQLDAGYSHFSMYNALASYERTARSRSLGLWAVDSQNVTSTSRLRSYDLVNINTATQSQLTTAMPDISSETARSIVRYRVNYPFSDIQDIMFSDGLTREEYNTYAYLLTVYTNINKATQEELRMTGLTASEARAVIAYREDKLFTSTYQLNTNNIISYDKYREIEPFITVND